MVRLCLLLLLALAAPPATTFIRVAKDAQGQPQSLQVAITRYEGKGVTVDLIAALHVGERSYYQALNRAFKGYDALLYELIGEPGTVLAKRDAYNRGDPSGFSAEGSDNPLTAFQSSLREMLGLEYQLERIEYGAPNFVHADMTPAEFSESWSKQGETLQSMLGQLMEAGLDQPEVQHTEALRELDLMGLLLRGPTAREKILLRQFLAYRFERPETMERMLGGKVILGARNDKALDVLAQQIKAGHRKLGLFYGAAHLPDLERKMVPRFGLKKTSQRWLVAWDLRLPARKTPEPDGSPSSCTSILTSVR